MSDHGFNTAQISFIKQLITNRNKEVRHEVSDHLDNTLPIKKLSGQNCDVGSIPIWDGSQWIPLPGPTSDGSGITGDIASQGGAKWRAPIIGGYWASHSRNTAASAGWIALPNSLFDTAMATEKTLSGSSHFNTTTGVFTCPVTGWYDLHYRTSVATVSDTGLLGNGLYINGALRYPRHFGPETEWYMSTCERVYLTINDTVAIRIHNPTAGAITMVGLDLGRSEDCLFSWRLVA